MKRIVAILNIFISFNLLATGFSGGDQYTSTDIEGRITVSCHGNTPGPTYAVHICRSNVLNPGEYSYFKGPTGDYDSVTLQANWENGKKSIIKTEKYDGKNGISKKLFNLWIVSLTQRPLLDYGKNIVNYQLIKNKTTIESGSFNTDVVDAGTRVCQRDGHYTSSNNADCTNPSQFCDNYFRVNRYCY